VQLPDRRPDRHILRYCPCGGRRYDVVIWFSGAQRVLRLRPRRSRSCNRLAESAGIRALRIRKSASDSSHVRGIFVMFARYCTSSTAVWESHCANAVNSIRLTRSCVVESGRDQLVVRLAAMLSSVNFRSTTPVPGVACGLRRSLLTVSAKDRADDNSHTRAAPPVRIRLGSIPRHESAARNCTARRRMCPWRFATPCAAANSATVYQSVTASAACSSSRGSSVTGARTHAPSDEPCFRANWHPHPRTQGAIRAASALLRDRGCRMVGQRGSACCGSVHLCVRTAATRVLVGLLRRAKYTRAHTAPFLPAGPL
jgi:hypothetical protein